ncbi:hypothetical protein H2199_004025 [Coniosporium tulheliwenetii]|uniref:Uncharacterized protein n=1 Tax=Coniosporium tulheliwenetii TaxID=3383036 RepID=A0ACC2Z6K2_9PEZI|nr:hypothetical protein H2199_004025 [Cladosporium sp. JES 115]
MSIEFCYTVDFLGQPDSPNLFSQQLLQNIEDISGTSPVLRIGGNTQDLAQYCENCLQAMNSTYRPGSTEAINVTFSKSLFKVLNENGPSSQEYVFGLNLGRNNVEIAKAELTGALAYLNQSKLIAYELGNEPDHYVWPIVNYRSPATWDMLAYVKQTMEWLSQLSAGQRFQYGSIATSPTLAGDWTMVQAIKLGIHKLDTVKIISSHAYPGHVCTPEFAALVKLENYVNHLNTVQYFSAYIGEIDAAKSVGLTYHMGETNSAACHGKDGVSNTMGALLWTIDYSLYLASLGADRLFFHNGVGDFFYSMWEPVALNDSAPAHINPQYYSMLLLADVVADLDSPRVYRVSYLDTYDLAHYAIYDGFVLQKLVLLNMHYHNSTTETRPPKSINVAPVLGKDIKMKRLTAPNTIAKTGVMWGMQAVDETGKIAGEEVTETRSDGVVILFASEAVIVEKSS